MDRILDSEHLYQDPAGGNAEPNPLWYDYFPSLRWDTYAAVPEGFPHLASFAPHDVTNPFVIDDQHFQASWFDTYKTGRGRWRIARITLSSEAGGTLGGETEAFHRSGDGGSFEKAPFDGRFAIVGGHIVPEPAALTALALGAVGFACRRYRPGPPMGRGVHGGPHVRRVTVDITRRAWRRRSALWTA